MRLWLGVLLALVANSAWSADFSTLRKLQAPPPVTVAALASGEKARSVEFARIVLHPKDGEAWAVVYFSQEMLDPSRPGPSTQFLTWNSGKMDAETSSFGRIFAEELRSAGFAAVGGDSLFDDSNAGSAELKVGVLIDDIKGRFCLDCPSLFHPKDVPANVVMAAHWQVYSSLDRKVIAKVDTAGGINAKAKLQDSVMPAVFGAFRENVRLLLASEEFRRVVTAPVGSGAAPAATPQSTIALDIRGATASVPQAAKSVAVVYAADGSGSGFLVSADGLLLTNQHVVGGSKYVKLKWADGSETLGEVIRADARRDVALVKTEAKARAPLALRHGAVQQGETVFAIGTPLEDRLQNTMTKGIVSATRTYEGQPFIQSDVGVTHGNSGGPLIDEKGAVIGLTVMGLHPDESKSLNLFIPIDDALRALAVKPAA